MSELGIVHDSSHLVSWCVPCSTWNLQSLKQMRYPNVLIFHAKNANVGLTDWLKSLQYILAFGRGKGHGLMIIVK